MERIDGQHLVALVYSLLMTSEFYPCCGQLTVAIVIGKEVRLAAALLEGAGHGPGLCAKARLGRDSQLQ
jgi:hypothetical protein